MSDKRQSVPWIAAQAWAVLAVGVGVLAVTVRRLEASGELGDALCAGVEMFSWVPALVWSAMLPMSLGLCGLAVASLWLSRQRSGLVWLTLVPAWVCVAVLAVCGVSAGAPC